jgi:2-polyprenyl-3-methyl-5-hydroxy-6-metoxy-1,4-benzoquinol methylase
MVKIWPKLREFSLRTSKDTSEFYDNLVAGRERRSFLGVNNRYKVSSAIQSKFLERYFDSNVKKYIKSSDTILDFGCGSGIFSRRMSFLCTKVIGVDISRGFIQSAISQNDDNGNVRYHHIDTSFSFPERVTEMFDVVLSFDVIHHLEDAHTQLVNPLKLLKPSGRVLIYEPNLLNPAILLMHLFDKNERGLLRLGTPNRYRRLLAKYNLEIEHMSYSGIVIGPANRVFWWTAKLLESKYLSKIAWLNPKIFISCKKA